MNIKIVPALSAQMDPYPAIGMHANHMDMTKFGGDDSAGYIKVLSELRRYIQSAVNTVGTAGRRQEGGNVSTEGERETGSGRGGIIFNGAITGHNVISGTQTTQGGTTNFTFK